MSNSATPTLPSSSSSSSLREVVALGPQGLLTAPGGGVGAELGQVVLAGAALGGLDTDMVARSCRDGGYVEVRKRSLTGPVTLVAVVGLYLHAGVGYQIVLARMWTALASLHPALTGTAVVSAQAFSAARVRLGEGPLRKLFCAHAAAAWTKITTRARCGDGTGTLFGLVLVAVDGTVLDAGASGDIQAVYSRPSGGLYPQVRLLTVVHCASRRVIAAVHDAITISEQVLWDRMVTAGALGAGMLLLADRNLCATRRLVTFPAQLGGTGGMFLGPWLTRTRKGMGTVACQ